MLGSIDVLSDKQTKQTIKSVEKLEKVWIRRAPIPMDFFTVGACTYQEGCESIVKYHKHRSVMNPVLKKHFSWLYDIVVDKLSEVFGPAEIVDELGYPGFHIFGHKPNKISDPRCVKRFHQPLASLHVDIQYKEHIAYWNTYDEVDFEDPLSFTLPIELPKNGGGLWLWNWLNLPSDEIDKFNFQGDENKDETIRGYMGNMDPRDSPEFWANSSISLKYDAIYDTKPMAVPYEVGKLFYHTGHILHQIIPGYNLDGSDRRITLQGHGVKCDGIWKIYF
jgi:hypothetical protein|tara:strand:+ start:99 stop:932 length:834 start_codon:yes stop_codon:yes gene_type:complete